MRSTKMISHKSFREPVLACEGFGGIAVFRHVLIDRLQRFGAVWDLWDGINPFHGVLRIVGIGFAGAGDGLVVALRNTGGE